MEKEKRYGRGEVEKGHNEAHNNSRLLSTSNLWIRERRTDITRGSFFFLLRDSESHPVETNLAESIEMNRISRRADVIIHIRGR